MNVALDTSVLNEQKEKIQPTLRVNWNGESVVNQVTTANKELRTKYHARRGRTGEHWFYCVIVM